MCNAARCDVRPCAPRDARAGTTEIDCFDDFYDADGDGYATNDAPIEKRWHTMQRRNDPPYRNWSAL